MKKKLYIWSKLNWLSISNAVNLKRDMAILFNRIGLISLSYTGWISYTTTNLMDKAIKLHIKITNVNNSYVKFSKKGKIYLVNRKNKTSKSVKDIYLNSKARLRWLSTIDQLLPHNLDYASILYYLNSHIESLKIFLMKYESIDISNFKFLFTFTLSTLFFTLLFTDFYAKHLSFLKKIKNNFSIYKLLIILFIIVILFIPRIYAKHFVIAFIFDGEITFMSLALSILWLLPFMVYIANILIKIFIGQITKRDFNLFNSVVISSVNLYTIFIILFSIYLGFNGYYYIIFSNLLNFIIPNPSTYCMHIVPRISDIFSISHGSYTKINNNNPLKAPDEYWKLKENAYFRPGRDVSDEVFPNPFGKTMAGITNKKSHIWKEFDRLENHPDNKLLRETIMVSFNPEGVTAASVIVENNGEKTLFLRLMDKEFSTKNKIKEHTKFFHKDFENREEINKTIEECKSNNIGIHDLASTADAIVISAPDELTYRKYSNMDLKQTHTLSYANGNLTCMDRLSIGKSSTYRNIEDAWPLVYNGYGQRDFLISNKHKLDLTSNRLSGSWGFIFHAQDKIGVFKDIYNKAELQLATVNTANLPFIKCKMIPEFNYQGLKVFDAFFGFELPKNLYSEIITYVEPIPLTHLRGEFFKVPLITYYNSILNNDATSVTTIQFPWGDLAEGVFRSRVEEVLQRVIPCLDIFYPKPKNGIYTNEFYSDTEENQVLLQKDIKKELVNSVFANEAFSFLGYLMNDAGRIYKSNWSGNTVLLVEQKDKHLFDGIIWNLENEQMFVPNSIDFNLKNKLFSDLNCKNKALNMENGCIRKKKFIVIFWDNFSVEFTLASTYCAEFCNNYHRSLYPEVESVNFIDENQNYKSKINLLNTLDRHKFYWLLYNIRVKPFFV